MSKKTVVLGASPNETRYSNRATRKLKEHGHEVIPLGIRGGQIDELDIQTNWPDHVDDLNTVTLYVGPQRQQDIMQYVVDLKPERVIFNPGTENPVFYDLLNTKGIAYEEACTLVLLSIGDY